MDLTTKRLFIVALMVVACLNIAVQVMPGALGLDPVPERGLLPESEKYYQETRSLGRGELFRPDPGRGVAYQLLSVPIHMAINSPMVMLVLPALSGAFSIVIFHGVLLKAGLEKKYALLGSLVLLSSRLYAFMSATADPAVVALLFGWVFVFYWLKNSKGRAGSWVTGATGVAAVLAGGTNLCLLAAAAITDLRHRQLKGKSWWKLPLLLVAVSLFTINTLQLPILLPPQKIAENVYGAGGMVLLFAALGVSYFSKHQKNQTMELFFWIVALNLLAQLFWGGAGLKSVLGLVPALVYFLVLWFERRASFRDAILATVFIMVFDGNYSVLGLLPGIIGTLF